MDFSAIFALGCLPLTNKLWRVVKNMLKIKDNFSSNGLFVNSLYLTGKKTLGQGALTFLGTGRREFERAAQSAPVRTRKRFLVRFNAKTAGGNLGEHQKRVFTMF